MTSCLVRTARVITHKNKYRPLDLAKPGKVTPPRHGLNVQLTLDMGMQRVVEEELDAGLKEFSAKKGAICADESQEWSHYGNGK